MSRKVMISAGETSGELYGAMLSRELKKTWPDVEISGIGGDRMKSEGVTLIAPVTHVLGIVEAVRHLNDIRKTLKKATQFLVEQKPDILVLIDYPDFNIALAQRAKDAGIPVLYYVSPQVWAWRGGRVKKIASLVDRMAVLFPFEVKYYERSGLPCEFVGHPITETIKYDRSKEELKKGLGLDPEREVLALLPGSRPNELKRHQPIIRELIDKIHTAYPEIQIVVPLVPGSHLTAKFPDDVRIVYGRTSETLACSEAAAVASGTATLETALMGTPMVVFYRVSPITYFLGRILTSVKCISLVNILSEKNVVLELLQKDANPDRIFSELKRLLKDGPYRSSIISSLNNIRDMLSNKKPSARVAAIIGQLAGW